MRENITVVILAAGLGTRMKSNKAKVLHEAGGDTLLNHVIRAALHVAPAEHIVAVIGHQGAAVRATVKTGGIRFAEQLEQKGTGHAMLCAAEAARTETGQLLILNGDGPLLKPETLQMLIELQAENVLGGSLVTTELKDPTGYGRIVRNDRGWIAAIVEQKAATSDQLQIREINPGIYCFDAQLFWRNIGEVKPDNPAREYYLTDMVEILTRNGHAIAPLLVRDETELLGINTRVELALADRILRMRKATELMLNGVTIENPESVSIDASVEVGQDSVIEPNVHLRGTTRVGANCRIGTGSVLRNCEVGPNATVLPYVVADASTIEASSSIGPFVQLVHAR